LEPRGDSNAISLASPASLGRLETTIHLYLDQWSVNDEETVLCFDSISSLLRHVDRTTGFRFLYSLTEYLRQQSVLAHFHIDPDLHDNATIAMMCSLFDAVHGRSEDVENVSADVLLTLLGAPRRRLVCRYLSEVADPAPISAITERIAEWEGAGTASENERERVHITLHHVHLPELADTGVLERDGEMVSSTVESGTLDRYVRLTANDSSPEVPPALPNRESIRPSDSSVDESDETYWTVYGTGPDSIAVTLARALADVQNTPATELRPVLADAIDIDALQRLSDHGDISVYAAFKYEGYEVVVDSGEIKLYDSR
jgi:Halobacterial output domain 1